MGQNRAPSYFDESVLHTATGYQPVRVPDFSICTFILPRLLSFVSIELVDHRERGRSTPVRPLLTLEFGLLAPLSFFNVYADFRVRGTRLCGVVGLSPSSSQ